jgi:hypothetical protein
VRAWITDLLQSDPSPNKAVGFSEMGMMGVDERNRKMFQDSIRTIVEVLNGA